MCVFFQHVLLLSPRSLIISRFFCLADDEEEEKDEEEDEEEAREGPSVHPSIHPSNTYLKEWMNERIKIQKKS